MTIEQFQFFAVGFGFGVIVAIHVAILDDIRRIRP